MNSIYPLGAAALLFVLSLAESCNHRADADAWTADEVAVARLCVSEASFSATADCRAITWIVSRQAERRGVSIAEYVARQHHRHVRSEQRPWIGGLDASMERPEGWPEDQIAWEPRGVALWSRRLAEVRGYLADGQHGCSAAPAVWGGLVTDHARILRLEARGYERVDCGVSRNAFLRRGAR